MNKNLQHTYVAIMAGGIGSRFWPSSTEETPKQFLDILGTGKSLLRITYERFLHLLPSKQIYFVTHLSYRDKILEHIPEITAEQVICEPSRNNTAPGIAYAAFKIHKMDPQATLIMAPSDHVILKEIHFLELLEKGVDFCQSRDVLLTLGILPTRPDTGYGYIKCDAKSNGNPYRKVEEFKEKPNLQTAMEYLESGDYLWNSGMFIWRTAIILEAFQKFAPEIHQILARGEALYNTKDEMEFIAKEFPKTPSISVDYAIMENADNIYTIPADIDWSDLGTWNALHAFLPKDQNANVILGKNSLLQESTNNIIKMHSNKVLIAKDLKDFMVIDEEDVLLIYPKNKEQEIKKVREQVIKKFYDK
jgi:mannose-1-phosphate guanylyltransferase